MTEQQYKKREKLINILSVVPLVVLIAFLAVCAWKGLADTIIFPIGVGAMLALHWCVSDVISAKYLNLFDGKTDDQKRSYYVYAGMELVGFGGLTYFLVDMNSTTGAIIYIVCLFLKKKFIEEFRGAKQEEPEEEIEESVEEEAEEVIQEEMPVIELEIPEVRATEEDLIAQTQVQKSENS